MIKIKQCTGVCGRHLEDTTANFNVLSKKTPNVLRPRCRECSVAKSRKYYAENKERIREEFKCRLYGLETGDYDRMYRNQEGKCKICEVTKDVLNIDHNHTTGEVRDLLCHNCNVGLGHFEDSVSLLREALIYLENHQ